MNDSLTTWWAYSWYQSVNLLRFFVKLQSPAKKKKKKGLELHVRSEFRDRSLGTKEQSHSTLECLLALSGFIFAYKGN